MACSADQLGGFDSSVDMGMQIEWGQTPHETYCRNSSTPRPQRLRSIAERVAIRQAHRQEAPPGHAPPDEPSHVWED